MSDTILITGANGFVGSRLVKELSTTNNVVATYRTESAADTPVPGVQYIKCDLIDLNATYKLFENYSIDAVVHTAAVVKSDEDNDCLEYTFKNNVEAQANILSAALSSKCKKFIFCSTISVYDGHPIHKNGFRESDCVSPNSIYGWSKYSGEEMLRVATSEKDMNCISLRFSGVHGYGRNTGVVFNMIKSAIQGNEILINEPHSIFKLTFIEDVVSSILIALSSSKLLGYSCYNVSGKEALSLPDLASIIKRICNSNCIVSIINNGKKRYQIMDTHKAELDLNFQPLSIEEKINNYKELFLSKTN